MFTCTSSISVPACSCLLTSWTNHSLNLPFSLSLNGLFMLKLKGWKRSVQLFGTCTGRILLLSRRACTLSHMWPLKTSKITRATWSGVDNFSRTSWTYGRMPFLMNQSVVSSLAQWFVVCHMSKPLGNVWEGWHLSVFPWYRICRGSSSPESVPTSVAVTWHLSLDQQFQYSVLLLVPGFSLMMAPAWHLLDPNWLQVELGCCEHPPFPWSAR